VPALVERGSRAGAAGSGRVVCGGSMGTEFSREDANWDRHDAFVEA
jgi:hypothetical protein